MGKKVPPPALIRKLLELESPFFLRLLELGEAEEARVASELDDVRGDEHRDALLDEAGEGLLLSQRSAELAMVALYHWVERTLKLELRAIYKCRAAPADIVNRMVFDTLAGAYRGEGIDVAALTNGAVITRTLRIFANSWKHNAESASEYLMKELGFPQGSYGHFGDRITRDAMATRAGGQPDCSGPDIVRLYVSLAVDYLCDLLTRTSTLRFSLAR